MLGSPEKTVGGNLVGEVHVEGLRTDKLSGQSQQGQESGDITLWTKPVILLDGQREELMCEASSGRT